MNSYRRLEERVALVTGASKGIGRAVAVALSREGADVVLTGRTVSELERTADSVRIHGSRSLVCTADFLDQEQVSSLASNAIDEFGRIDILVNNAAIIHPRIDLVDIDVQTWYDVIEVNLNATAMLTKAIIPAMIAGGSGSIVNISSIGGRKGGRGRSAYRVTKAGLISLTETLAAELYEHGINVNCICPGGTDTEGYREAFNTRGRADNPRLMAPEEIAEVAVFLASDASSAITGAAIDAFGQTNPLFA